MKHARVVRNNRYEAWYAIWSDDEGHHSQKLGDFRSLQSKLDAVNRAVELGIRINLNSRPLPTVNNLVEGYRRERQSKRFSTRYSEDQWLTNHIIPKWGKLLITNLQARDVELWLLELKLSPKSRVHIRSIISRLWDYGMWSGQVPRQVNPMELVVIKGATKRRKKPRSLTEDEFRKFVAQLREPYRTIALIDACLGLRISETLALRWADVGWVDNCIRIERGIVRQRVGPLKTDESEQSLPLDPRMTAVLEHWRVQSLFREQTDWIFPSDVYIGRLPLSYPGVWKAFKKAAADAGLPHFGTHSLRHTYRSWLDATGTPLGIQQKLMRHADIRTTMNQYGEADRDRMQRAQSVITGKVLQ